MDYLDLDLLDKIANEIEMELDKEQEEDKGPPIPDSMNMYLNTIGQHVLLEADEEKELARQAIAGEWKAKVKLIECNLTTVQLKITKNLAGVRILGS